MKNLDKPKQVVSDTTKTIARVVNNAERLVISISLLVTTVFAYTHLHETGNQAWKYTVTFCLVVVGLYAFAQLITFLNKDK